jgi:hypothetical protein
VVESADASVSLVVSWTPSPLQSGHELRPVVNHWHMSVYAGSIEANMDLPGQYRSCGTCART